VFFAWNWQPAIHSAHITHLLKSIASGGRNSQSDRASLLATPRIASTLGNVPLRGDGGESVTGIGRTRSAAATAS